MRESNEVLIALLGAAGLVVRGAQTGMFPGPERISPQLGQNQRQFSFPAPLQLPVSSPVNEITAVELNRASFSFFSFVVGVAAAAAPRDGHQSLVPPPPLSSEMISKARS